MICAPYQSQQLPTCIGRAPEEQPCLEEAMTGAATEPFPGPRLRDPQTSHRDIIVIGASAGGLEALIQEVRRLPADLPAAVFVLLHLPAGARSSLAAILGREGKLPTATAQDGATIMAGHM
jgi:chemotaxis response regulator CheB